MLTKLNALLFILFRAVGSSLQALRVSPQFDGVAASPKKKKKEQLLADAFNAAVTSLNSLVQPVIA